MRETSTGIGDGTKMAFMGLSDMPWPTRGWSNTNVMLWALSWSAGPTPLNISICGLPRAPADTMISLLVPLLRYALCLAPDASLNTTPWALGLDTPAWLHNSIEVN